MLAPSAHHLSARRAAMLLFAVSCAVAAQDRPLTVCFRNAAQLRPLTLALTGDAIRSYARELNADIQITCVDPDVTISLLAAPRDHQPPDALGAVRTRGGAILPEIEIYCQPIRAMLDTRLDLSEARAYAMVAAHELSHYLRQSGRHGSAGLDSEYLSKGTLAYGVPRLRGRK